MTATVTMMTTHMSTTHMSTTPEAKTPEVTTGVIVGSAFSHELPDHWRLEPHLVQTPHGPFDLFKATSPRGRVGFIAPRHGVPHRWLPHQIPWRAMCWALRHVGAQAVLVTSSAGVLDQDTPLHQPLLVRDVLMLDPRLPDGSPCTMFLEPSPEQGHLVLEGGLCHQGLGGQLRDIAQQLARPIAAEVTFAYVPGPRTKTRAENALWATLGAQVNSMTLAPELVLLNELQVPCAAVVVGHKRSSSDRQDLSGPQAVTRSLEDSRAALEALILGFMELAQPVRWDNHLYRFQGSSS